MVSAGFRFTLICTRRWLPGSRNRSEQYTVLGQAAMATTNHVPGQPGDLACSEPCLDGKQNDDPVSVEVPGYVSADILKGLYRTSNRSTIQIV
jgi:hypothetical protein